MVAVGEGLQNGSTGNLVVDCIYRSSRCVPHYLFPSDVHDLELLVCLMVFIPLSTASLLSNYNYIFRSIVFSTLSQIGASFLLNTNHFRLPPFSFGSASILSWVYLVLMFFLLIKYRASRLLKDERKHGLIMQLVVIFYILSLLAVIFLSIFLPPS